MFSFPLAYIFTYDIRYIQTLTLKWRDAFPGKANSSATRCPSAKKTKNSCPIYNTLLLKKNQTRNEKWLGYYMITFAYIIVLSFFVYTRVRELYIYKCIWKHRAVQFVFFACLLVWWCNTHRLQRLYIFYFLSLNRVGPLSKRNWFFSFFFFLTLKRRQHTQKHWSTFHSKYIIGFFDVCVCHLSFTVCASKTFFHCFCFFFIKCPALFVLEEYIITWWCWMSNRCAVWAMKI